MMNISTSDCSSGCESGWTMYLDQSSQSADHQLNDHSKRRANVCVQNHQEDVDDDDEDLSMVSDASSGPRLFEEDLFDESGSFGYAYSSSASEQRRNKQKNKVRESKGKQQKNSNLDDTASSPVFTISKEDQASLEHVGGFKGKSTLKQHFGFLKSSVPGKAASEKSGGFQGRKWQ